MPDASKFDVSAFDGQRAFRETEEFVVLGPKLSGTPGAEHAARHLMGRLTARGLDPAVDEFRDDTPRGPIVFRNVISRVRGRGPGTIVIGCHYDTKGGIGDEFQGANDSGSGVGVLLELASVFARGPRVQPDILLVFFDGEECVKEYSEWDGLHGSRHLAARMKAGQDRVPVRAVIVVDMVGDRDLTLTVPAGCSPRLVSMLFAAAREESVRERVSLAAGGILDDHAPFLEAGMPAIDLIDFQYGSQPGRNDYWHTPEDRMDRLSPQSLQTVGRMILRMVNGLL